MTEMKTRFTNFLSLLATLSFMLASVTGQAQGTINYDANNNWIGTRYVEFGLAFQVVLPLGGSYDYMGIGYGAGNTPYNGSPWMGWIRQNNPYSYVSLSLTNGALFGLTSLELADPIYPSISPIAISFVGYLSGGTTVTNIFTTPGNGTTTFATYQFNPDFASGLLSVQIDAPRWAMDNLVFVIPEPGSATLFLAGAVLFGCLRRRSKRHWA